MSDSVTVTVRFRGPGLCVSVKSLPHPQGLQRARTSTSHGPAHSALRVFSSQYLQGSVKRIIFNFAKEVGSPSAVDRTDYGNSLRQRPGLRPAPLATALARRRLWRRAKHQQPVLATCVRVAHSFMTGLNVPPTPLRAGLLARPAGSLPPPIPRQGFQGSHVAPQPLIDQRTAPSSQVFSSVLCEGV